MSYGLGQCVGCDMCVCGGGGGYSDVGVRFSVELRGGCCNVM